MINVKPLRFSAFALAISLSSNAFPAFLSLSGGALRPFSQGDTIDRDNGISALYGVTSISGYTGGTLEISEAATVTLTYMGSESQNSNGFRWGDSTSFVFITGGDTNSCDGGTCGIWNSSGFHSEVVQATAAGALSFQFNAGSIRRTNGSQHIFAYKVDDYTYDLWLNDNSAYYDHDDMVVRVSVSPVPIPAAAWLFGSALMGMAGVGYRSRLRRLIRHE